MPAWVINITDAATESFSWYPALSNCDDYQLSTIHNSIFIELLLLIIILSPLCLLLQPAHPIEHFLLFWARKEGSRAPSLRT